MEYQEEVRSIRLALKKVQENPTLENVNYLEGRVAALRSQILEDREWELKKKIYPTQCKMAEEGEEVIVLNQNSFDITIDGEHPMYGMVMDVDHNGRLEVALGHEGFSEWFELKEVHTKKQLGARKWNKLWKIFDEEDW